MSMYRQLWLAMIVSTLLALLGGLLASTQNARQYLSQQLTSKNVDNAAALALSLSRQEPDPVMVDLTVASLFDSGHYELIRVVDPAGKIMSERIAPAGQYGVPDWFVRLLPLNGEAGEASISNGWRQLGTITVLSNSGVAYRSLWNSIWQLMGALCVTGLLGGYLGTRILRRLQGPLDRVIGQAQAVSQRNFVTIDEPAVPELRQLAAAMNSMVLRIKTMFEEEAGKLKDVRLKANADPLTGLANQTFFVVQLLESLDSEDKIDHTLLLVRLLDMSGIEARLGTPATNQLLKACAKILADHTRGANALAARFKDADFAMLMHRTADTHALADTLILELQAAGRQAQVEHLQVAIGLARLQPGQDLAGLMAEATSALAQAAGSAAAGGGSAVHHASTAMSGTSPAASQWMPVFQQALEEKRVRLASTPVVDLNGRLIHRECVLEVLLQNQDGWQPMGRLSQIAEQLGLTSTLDMKAVQLGLAQLREVPGVSLAITISAISCREVRFVKELLGELARDVALASRLSLQLPEADATEQLPAFRTFCVAVKKTGCSVGLQHVGRQLGDIGQLHDLGLSYLKVDSSFIRGLHYNTGNQNFLRGLTSIAHHIGTDVYAEGVVDPLELAELAALGLNGAAGPAAREHTG